MRSSVRLAPLAAGAMALAALATQVWARGGTPIPGDLAAELSGPWQAGQRVVVPRLVLDDGNVVSLDLEAFEVFAPDAQILDYAADGVHRLPPPPDRYFRGTVVGDPDSVVMLASGETLRGLVATNGEVYAIAAERDTYRAPGGAGRSLLRRIDPEGDRPVGAPPWRCFADEIDGLESPPAAVSALDLPSSCNGDPAWTATAYTINLAIETDYELYTKFNSTTLELAYIADLTAAASVIYLRDVHTTFQIGTTHLWTTASDPWTATDTESALYELGDYWHSHYSGVSRTIVHFLSGKNMGGGIAWLSVLCSGDFTCTISPEVCGSFYNHWGGGYGLSSSLNGQFSITNPALYWDLQCFTHEIGHNFGSPHTHCYTPPIDTCYNAEPGCYSGPLCGTAGQPSCSGGTIMSYCHLRPGGYNNIILFFGLLGQPSEAVRDCMRAFVESNAACLGVFESCTTPSAPSLTLPASVASGTKFTVKWNATSYDNSYELQDATDSGFSSPNTTVVTGASLDVVRTVSSTRTIYFRVRAINTCAASTYRSSWSSTGSISVTTGSGCSALTVANQTISNATLYTSCSSITAGPALLIAPTAAVTFRAATSVILANGAAVEAGGSAAAGTDASLALSLSAKHKQGGSR
jgi:hypothetical protein